MTREQIGILLLALAIIVHALFPRYEFQLDNRQGLAFPYRLDRWTGRVEAGTPNLVSGPQDWYFGYSDRE